MYVRVLLVCDVCMFMRSGAAEGGVCAGVLVHIAYCASRSFAQLTRGLVFCVATSAF
jgi:hypothetical protein